MRRLVKDIGLVLAVAAIIQYAAIVAIPRLVMDKVVTGITRKAGGANLVLHARLPSAADRIIPLPSPDLLYSACAIDLAHGPVQASLTPGSDYLSLSVFDMKTDNVFVTSDRQAHGQKIRLVFTIDDTTAIPEDASRVILPGGHGLLLLRALAATPDMQARSQAVRETLSCGPV
jgi:uncharacterized membrane protein